MFDKQNFLEYMQSNFNLDIFSIRLLDSLVDYGEEHCDVSKGQLVNFLCDILVRAEPSIEYDEIDQFYYE